MAAELFGVAEPERVFFTLNTTHALNTVLKGLLKQGDHALCSDLEHNAVYRPLYKMAQEGRVTFDLFPAMVGNPNRSATRICAGIARRKRPNTRLVVCTHGSNICSATMPIREIGSFCHRHGLLLVVDAAQTAGHEEIRVDEMQIDALCVPGHKGLYGPQGCGMVLLGKGVTLETLTEGGNGVLSLEGGMPEFSPERYEAGTLPTPAIMGLAEGLRSIRTVGTEEILVHEKSLYRLAREQLGNLSGVELYAPADEGAILLFNVKGASADTVGHLLDEAGFCVRSGYHCSALGHRSLGTPEGGAVRVSFGMYNRASEVEALSHAVERICREGVWRG